MFKLENGTIIQLYNVCRVFYDEVIGSWYISMVDGTAEKITQEDYQSLCDYVSISASIINKLS